jgi:hypothetical protein
MSMQELERAAPSGPTLTPLPRLEDLPIAEQGYGRAEVENAFDSFRRHVTALQANLRVTQAAPKGAGGEPSGHAVRMDALHLIRAAAEFADTIEQDAQEAAARQIGRAEQEIREAQIEAQQREAEISRIRQETERQRVEVLNAARSEAKEVLAKASRDAATEVREAEAAGSRLLEQSRHQATELTNGARAEVEKTLEWARAQAEVITQRARLGAEQLLSAAGHGDAAIQEAVEAIVRAAEESVRATRGPAPKDSAPASTAEAEESEEPGEADEAEEPEES